MRKAFYIFILSIAFCQSAQAQKQKTGRQIIEEIEEIIASDISIDHDLSELTENLEYYYQWPLNINTASINDLDKLVILNDFQIKSLLNYINNTGPLQTIYELQLIEGFNQSNIKLLLPFVKISHEAKSIDWKISNALKYGKNEVFLRTITTLETPVGYENVSDSILAEEPNKYYPGDKYRVYTRYTFNYKNKIKWGITAEKDPGEQFFAGEQQNGFDFYSAHLQINDLGIFKTIVVGDYQAKFGQGLAMWSYISTSKSAYVMNIRKKGQGLKKYSSTDENSFLRGVGTTLSFKDVDFTVFGSFKNMDANISDSTADNKIYFSAFDNSGVHATPNQINKKDALNEVLAGTNISYNNKQFKIGVTGVANRYDIHLLKDSTADNNFNFSGNENYNISSDFQFMYKNLHLFGEAAISKSKGTAIVAGTLMKFTARFSGSILYRNYAPNYHSLYGNAFAEGSKTQNEKGMFMAIEMHPLKHFKLSAYYDLFKFPWLTSTVNSPSQGSDYLVQLDYSPSNSVSMYGRFKQENKPINSDEFNGVPELIDTDKASARYHINYKLNDKWQFRNRVELSRYKQLNESEYGYLLYQDIICSPFKTPISFKFRYALFETESYNTRIYSYESDLLNVYSVPALYNKGTRTYLMLQYKLLDRIDFWIKYSQTWYANKKSIGSGLNEIEGDTKSEIKFQIRIKI